LGELEEDGIHEFNLSIDEDEFFPILESMADNGVIVKQVRRLAEGWKGANASVVPN
jgi:hypothetical protein